MNHVNIHFGEPLAFLACRFFASAVLFLAAALDAFVAISLHDRLEGKTLIDGKKRKFQPSGNP
jgi:hypothetical protein